MRKKVKNIYGEYVYYNKGAVEYGNEREKANCYPLVGGVVYKIDNMIDQFNGTIGEGYVLFKKINVTNIHNEVNFELIEIEDETGTYESRELQGSLSGTDAKVFTAYVTTGVSPLFEALEGMLARFVRTLANGLYKLVNYATQFVTGTSDAANIDIDSIIFNHYPDTSISFFNSNTGGDSPSKLIELFRDAVNKWYKAFTVIAIAGYIAILLYIGVKILLRTAGKDQGKYKEMLLGWCTGVLLLTLFPYAIKYAIEINYLLVEQIESSKKNALNIPDVSTSIDVSDFSLPEYLGEGEDVDYKVFAEVMEDNPFGDGEDSNYMAFMANKAHESNKLVDAIVYLIMVWQLIMILIMYYKRVFTIAFLIVIYPFVALSYAFDKAGDGKAQGFSVWAKELMVNIFVQTIHAIVYVFVIGATYSGGTYSGDWLLSIIGIRFLFEGEGILKKIIGQEASTAKTLQETAKRTLTTVGAVKLVSKNVAGNVVGAGSHLSQTFNMRRQWRNEKRTASVMDILAPAPKPYRMPTKDSLRTYDASITNKEYNDLAEDMVYVINRNHVTDPDEFAKHLGNILAKRNSSDANIQKLFESLDMTPDQLDELSKLIANVSKEAYEFDSDDELERAKLKEKIDQELTASLKIIFPGMVINDGGHRRTIDTENMAMMKSTVLRMLRSADLDEKHAKRSTVTSEVKGELDDAKRRRSSFFDSDTFGKNGFVNPFSESAKERAINSSIRDKILDDYFGGSVGASKENVQMAEYLSMLKEFSDMSKSGKRPTSTDKFSAKQMMEAANYVARYSGNSEATKKALKTMFDNNASDIRAMVAEEVGKQFTNLSDYDRKNFRKDLKRGEKTRVVSSIFYNAENAKSKGIDNPFADCDEAVPLNNNEISRAGLFATDIYHKRLRDLTDDERKTVENLAILEEFSRQSDITDNVDRNKHTTVQVLDAANYFAQHKDETGTFDEALKKYLGASKDELVDTVAEEIARVYKNPEDEINRHYVGTPGPEADLYKQKIEEGLSSKIYTDDSVSVAEIKRALKDNKEAYDMATKVFDAEAKDEKSRHFCEETMQKIGIRDAMRKDRENYYNDDTYVSYIVDERRRKNEEEMVRVEDIARELIDDTEVSRDPTYNGLTKEEHEQLSKDYRKKFEEELIRTGVTSVGAVLGGIAGTGLSIGLNDDDSAVSEGLKGAAAGAVVGDAIPEAILGNETRIKKVKILNPYTNTVDEIDVSTWGATADGLPGIGSNEVLDYNDPRLDPLRFQGYNLDSKLLENKREFEKQRELEERRRLYDEALRNRGKS